MLKKLGAELILTGMILPWIVWVTVGIFTSQKVEAVQENKYDNIIGMLKEIKDEVKAIQNKE